MSSLQNLLYFESFSADAVCFVPIDFREVHAAVLCPNNSATLEFTPIAGPVFFANTRQITDALAFSDNHDVCNVANDFKVHVAL